MKEDPKNVEFFAYQNRNLYMIFLRKLKTAIDIFLLLIVSKVIENSSGFTNENKIISRRNTYQNMILFFSG